jgi:hypothetical protein
MTTTILLILLTAALGITAGQLLALRRKHAATLARVATLRTQIADLIDTNNEATSLIYQRQATIDAQRAALAAVSRQNATLQQTLNARALRVIVKLPESPAPALTSICLN